MPVRLLAQNREIVANGTPVHVARHSFVHVIICSRGRCVPPLFTNAIWRKSSYLGFDTLNAAQFRIKVRV